MVVLPLAMVLVVVLLPVVVLPVVVLLVAVVPVLLLLAAVVVVVEVEEAAAVVAVVESGRRHPRLGQLPTTVPFPTVWRKREVRAPCLPPPPPTEPSSVIASCAPAVQGCMGALSCFALLLPPTRCRPAVQLAYLPLGNRKGAPLPPRRLCLLFLFSREGPAWRKVVV